MDLYISAVEAALDGCGSIDLRNHIYEWQRPMRLALRFFKLRSAAMLKVKRYLLYAVGEVMLIVMGILFAVQINNLNQNRITARVEGNYLDRLSEELSANIDYFLSQKEMNIRTKAVIESFSSVLNNPNSEPEAITEETKNYYTIGALLPKYRPSRTTFDDLSSTGNLGIISNEQLRDAIIRLYSSFERNQDIADANRVWAFDSDSRMAYDFNILGWDNRTNHLFPRNDPEREAPHIIASVEHHLRNAAIHFWVVDRNLELYDDSILQAEAVINLIRSEYEGR